MTPDKKIDEYTRYCITPEGKEYLRKMLEEKQTTDLPLIEDDIELNMDEEIDFEELKILDDDDRDLIDILMEEDPIDDEYDYWKKE